MEEGGVDLLFAEPGCRDALGLDFAIGQGIFADATLYAPAHQGQAISAASFCAPSVWLAPRACSVPESKLPLLVGVRRGINSQRAGQRCPRREGTHEAPVS